MEICQPPILQLLAKVLDANLAKKCTKLMSESYLRRFCCFSVEVFKSYVFPLYIPGPNRKVLPVALKLGIKTALSNTNH
jgi:hypothetical protein